MKHLLAILILAFLSTSTLAATDEKIAGFKRSGWAETDFSKTSIPLKQFRGGGPSKDGIPSIDNPVFKPVGEIKNLAPREPVVGLEINGDARAYPLQILMWHEIINDTVGGMPLIVTFCPLCNTAIVFESTVKGKVLEFGTTGLLQKSNLVMYDRQSQSWWMQFTGIAVVGTMLGAELKALPSRLESFENFKKRFPKGKVLIPNNRNMRNYGQNPYTKYDTMTFPFLYTGEMPKNIKPMERVVTFRNNGKMNAYALPLLAEKQRLTVDGITLAWTAGQTSALDSSLIAKGRDIGNITVQENRNGVMVDIPYEVTFAFVVTAFNPEVKINQ